MQHGGDGERYTADRLSNGPANRLRQGYGGPPKLYAKAETGHYVQNSHAQNVHGPGRAGHDVPTMYGRAVHVAEIAVLVLVVLMTMHQSSPRSGAHFSDRTNDVFFADVAAHSGMIVLAGDLRLIQLRTRRPVLVDSGALDTVMYSLETGAAMQRIMRDVYGLDMFNPPPGAVGSGRIPPLAHRPTWESYSPEKWRSIRREYGVTQVLAYADWSLQLPVSAQSRRLLLYDIPER